MGGVSHRTSRLNIEDRFQKLKGGSEFGRETPHPHCFVLDVKPLTPNPDSDHCVWPLTSPRPDDPEESCTDKHGIRKRKEKFKTAQIAQRLSLSLISCRIIIVHLVVLLAELPHNHIHLL